MAEWYVGSVQYAAIAQFAISTAYSVGNIVRQLAAPAVGSERAFRCTTAGTSGGAEPSWTLTEGGTTVSGTATFTEVTGNSAYGWAAASARCALILTSWAAAGDTVYVASDHDATQASGITWNTVGTVGSPLSVYCVDPAGSVPPVAADMVSVASGKESTTGANNITYDGTTFYWGIILSAGSGANAASINGRNVASGGSTFKKCAIVLANSSTSSEVTVGAGATNNVIVFDETPVTFGSVSQRLDVDRANFTWKNTASAIVGSVPTTLVNVTGRAGSVTLDGVDVSAAGSGKTLVAVGSQGVVVNIINCALGASVTVADTPLSQGGAINLVNSADTATGYNQQRYTYYGTLTTETVIVRSGGASDGQNPISWKVVTTANAKRLFPFDTFQIAQWNTTVGTPVTATIEIVNDGTTLTNAEAWMEVQYLGDSGAPLALGVSSGPATPLTTPTNVPTSSVTWTTTGIASPVKQYLQVTFTPEIAGLVRATVYIGRASKTVYIDPKLTLA